VTVCLTQRIAKPHKRRKHEGRVQVDQVHGLILDIPFEDVEVVAIIQFVLLI
jgi:hypothetical protein